MQEQLSEKILNEIGRGEIGMKVESKKEFNNTTQVWSNANESDLETFLISSQNKVKEMFLRALKKGYIDEEICNKDEIYNKIKDYANNKNTNIVSIENIHMFVGAIGCENCAIDVIQKLRKEDIYLYFEEEKIVNTDKDFDMNLGALITEASFKFQNEIFSNN